MYPSFPFRILPIGRVAEVDDPRHIQEMIEEVLFTAPDERVNRPDFGCGLQNMLFEPNGEAAAAATALMIQAELEQWLGDLIAVSDVDVEAQEGTMIINLVYRLRGDSTPRKARFVR